MIINANFAVTYQVPGAATAESAYKLVQAPVSVEIFPMRVFGARAKQILKEVTVVARIWHGYTKPEHADAYEAMLKPELLPGISKVQGYKGSYLLRRSAGNEIEFVTIMLWDSIEAIRAVTGSDYENAVVPEERRKHLAHYDPESAHYEIVATHQL